MTRYHSPVRRWARVTYRLLILLHPPAFRRRFGVEMLYCCEEACSSQLTVHIAADLAGSLLRQWIWRPEALKIAVALLGAVVTLDLGHLALIEPVYLRSVRDQSTAIVVLVMFLGAISAIILTTIFCVAWFAFSRKLRRREKLRHV